MSKANPKLSPVRDRLIRELRRAQDALERRQVPEAQHLALAIRAECAKANFHSAQVSWLLAVTSDMLGEPEVALSNISDAIAVDPLNLQYLDSLAIIVDRARRSLSDPARPLDDPHIPSLYQRLVDVGEADSAAHLTRAKAHLHAREYHAALRILGALTALSPSCAEAWALKATAARRLGQKKVADQAELEATGLGGAAPEFFPIGGRADA